MYHCPSNIFPNASSKAQKQSKKEKQFSTLSGLTQHLESGACHGGKRTFSIVLISFNLVSSKWDLEECVCCHQVLKVEDSTL